MGRSNEALAPASKEHVNAFSEIAQKHLRENEINQEPKKPVRHKKDSGDSLTAYPELIEAHPSIEEEFYRSSLTKEIHKVKSTVAPRLALSNTVTALSTLAATAVEVIELGGQQGPNKADGDPPVKEIDEIQPREPGFYIQLFTIPNKTMGLQTALELRMLNQNVEEQNFNMKTLSYIYRMVLRIDYFTSFDLQDRLMNILPVGIHQNPPPSSIIVYIPIPIYLTSGGGNKHWGYDNEGSENQDTGSSTRGMKNTECWPYGIVTSSEIYHEIQINVDRSPTWTLNAPITYRAQDLFSVHI
ncbi:hypothetical protein AYI70_g505 [Smittium culicis]|uniref:Uncharacterized protein n=1 Tax=Smittium culicis TaxID=133412 RepID=A0A1R1YGG6_9FUNG|nr:hypothetical protein AYI70_g505 [Smittium culicis]